MTFSGVSLPIDLTPHLEEWTTDATIAFALVGSYARGDAGPFSDIDVVRFVSDDEQGGESLSFLIDRAAEDGQAADTSEERRSSRILVVLSTSTPSQVESWFNEPGLAVNLVAMLRDGHALWDPQGAFAAIRQRAREFQWTSALQTKANRLAGHELVGWIEEVHKGLEGLRRDDTGRLLNARFGLSWGLVRAVRVQRGILSDSDNAFLSDAIAAAGPESRWAQLLSSSFGVAQGNTEKGPSLHETLRAGLLLYCETFELLREAIAAEHFPLIEETVCLIRSQLQVED